MTNQSPFLQWLNSNHALLLAEVRFPGEARGYVRWYRVRGKQFIARIYPDMGWEVYVPVCESINTTTTLDALDEYTEKKVR